MSPENPTQIHATGEATGFIPAPGDKGKPSPSSAQIQFVLALMRLVFSRALNAGGAPGVTDLVLNPDAHAG